MFSMDKIIYYNSTLLKGGTDTYMLELIKNIDKNKFHIDVIIKDGDIVDKQMLNELINLGCQVNLAKGSFIKRILFIRKFFKQNKNQYDVCHINATSQGTGLISYFAKKYGNIKKVIFHSHMGGNDNGTSIVDKVGKKLMFKYSTHFATCSTLASEFMYGNEFSKSGKVIKLNNSVDTAKFKFNLEIRNKLRKELNIAENEFVILHVGRFAEQKNHKRLLEIFSEVQKQHAKTKLLLIGAGELFEDIKTCAKTLNIEQNCLFLGLKNNVCDYMQAADCFVMPSLHEGLPIVAVEAQASGLPCILSDNISKETKLADYVDFIKLEEENSIWAKTILQSKNFNREIGEKILKENNFDHNSAIKIIENLYIK